MTAPASRYQPTTASLPERLRTMPSSLNDACRTMDEAAERLEEMEKAISNYFAIWDRCGGSEAIAAEEFTDARFAMRAVLQPKGFADEIKRADAGPPEASFDNASDMLGYLNAPREAEPVTPITNPLVLPAGIKAGDYASSSPIPEAPTIDSTPSCGQENDYRRAQGSIPDAPGGIPNYEFPYQQTFDAIAAATEIYPSKEQALGFSISVRKFQEAFNNHRDHRALKPQDGGKCEHGIAKVNCGICIPSEVFSGRSGR